MLQIAFLAKRTDLMKDLYYMTQVVAGFWTVLESFNINVSDTHLDYLELGQSVQVTLAAHPILLVGILGTGIAPLIGVSSGWAYYHTDHLHTIPGSRPESAWASRVPH